MPTSIFNQPIPDTPDIERNSKGDLKIEVVEVPLSECKIKFLNPNGNEVLSGRGGPQDKYIRENGFLVETPGINPMRVRGFELKMNYYNCDPAMVEIFLYDWTDGEQMDRYKLSNDEKVKTRVIDLK